MADDIAVEADDAPNVVAEQDEVETPTKMPLFQFFSGLKKIIYSLFQVWKNR
ncbi:hypothetical protein [Methylobacterium sp. WL116]|uniref:hypothetical protein n=1 Tax=Methylobacterium sp. WL116 TaxID=2603889 RepID=UPI00164F1D8F|nr:hypothetical protein [Methylobacterium sp. WL116]